MTDSADVYLAELRETGGRRRKQQEDRRWNSSSTLSGNISSTVFVEPIVVAIIFRILVVRIFSTVSLSISRPLCTLPFFNTVSSTSEKSNPVRTKSESSTSFLTNTHLEANGIACAFSSVSPFPLRGERTRNHLFTLTPTTAWFRTTTARLKCLWKSFVSVPLGTLFCPPPNAHCMPGVCKGRFSRRSDCCREGIAEPIHRAGAAHCASCPVYHHISHLLLGGQCSKVPFVIWSVMRGI